MFVKNLISVINYFLTAISFNEIYMIQKYLFVENSNQYNASNDDGVEKPLNTLQNICDSAFQNASIIMLRFSFQNRI